VVGVKPGQPTRRILLVDDNQENREMLGQLLRPLGFETREAKNGQEAYELWQAWRPHLILMDFHMPVLDGCQATELIKAEAAGSNPIIVATTASVYMDEVNDLMLCGFDDFIRKPIQAARIFAVLEQHLGVAFVYAGDGDTVVSAPQDPIQPKWTAQAAALPPQLQQNLKTAALQANMLDMEKYITETASYQPELARKLKILADDFEYGKIQAILQTANSSE
jgi:CheY-like chemotaxis protein